MNVILTAILSYLLLYRYFALFAITFLSALIAPLPSNTSMLASGAFAEQGFLNIVKVCRSPPREPFKTGWVINEAAAGFRRCIGTRHR